MLKTGVFGITGSIRPSTHQFGKRHRYCLRHDSSMPIDAAVLPAFLAAVTILVISPVPLTTFLDRFLVICSLLPA